MYFQYCIKTVCRARPKIRIENADLLHACWLLRVTGVSDSVTVATSRERHVGGQGDEIGSTLARLPLRMRLVVRICTSYSYTVLYLRLQNHIQ